MYKIGDLSRCLGLTVKTLRYWSDIGLLVPDEIDRFTGYRYYAPSKLGEAARIVALKELGFSLEEIGAFSDGDKCRLIEAKTLELSRLAEETARRLARLEELRNTITEGKSLKTSFQTTFCDAIPVFDRNLATPTAPQEGQKGRLCCAKSWS